ncbi:MAG: hypothetical protein JWQ09_2176 [Segetibacter sp.]|nr:hypothetical protein [Segetibacter sp.]
MTNISKYIESQGGILSGQLAEYLVKTQNIEESAARKRVERLKSPIHRLKGLFADNQSFIYHSDNYNSQNYFEKLEEAFETSAKRCFAVIVAINYNHGIILKSDLANYTFSPITKIKGHLLYSTLIDKLKQANVLIDHDEQHYSLNKFISNEVEPNFRHNKSIQFVKELVINQFAIWSRNIGLCSFKTGEMNKEVGGFQFTFASPSYINGLVQYKDSVPKPGFVVADVLIGNSTTTKEVEFFLQKINAIRASNPSLKLFPVLILDGVEIHAMNKLKKTGVLIATIREIFGESYNELLKNLINTITNAGVILKKDPESYINLMTQLTKLVNGKTNNLRGDLFELAVGYYYGKQCQSLDIGKKVRTENEIKEREIDVLANYESEVRVVECKGYNYPVDKEYVEKYLSDKIPAVRKWLEKVFPNKRQVFEIWSTGGFNLEATELLAKAKSNTKKYSIDYLDKTHILERANELHTSKFSEILKDYYFKEIV